MGISSSSSCTLGEYCTARLGLPLPLPLRLDVSVLVLAAGIATRVISVYTAVLVITTLVSAVAIAIISERPCPYSSSSSSRGGKCAVVTGANRGIGFQVAKLLGKEQWKVVIACRDKRKGIQAAEEIKQDAGKSVEIVVVQLDLADLASVRNCVEELEKIGGKVDCLVNNAGAMLMPEITRDGFEVQYQTNYLGHFALTNWMMKRKLFAKRARIINVSSILHWFASDNIDSVHTLGKRNRISQYCYTKLLNILFSNELNRKLRSSKSEMISVSVHPGVVATDFVDHFIPRWLRNLVTPILDLIQITPEQSAHAIVHACSTSDHESLGGKYLSLTSVQNPSNVAESKQLAEKLWNQSLDQISNINLGK